MCSPSELTLLQPRVETGADGSRGIAVVDGIRPRECIQESESLGRSWHVLRHARTRLERSHVHEE